VPELLAELFSSRVRAAVLSLLLPRPHLAFSLTEMSQRLGLPISSLQHECYKLVRIGLLRDERQGSSRRYRPDPGFPLLLPLTNLVARSASFVEAARGAAEAVPGVEQAWIVGEFADVDRPAYLVVVGWVGLDEIDGLFDRVRLALQAHHPGGGIELAYFPPDDWQSRQSASDRFTRELLESDRIELLAPGDATGDEDVQAGQLAIREESGRESVARRVQRGKGEG
jgi:DNA-binding transcriptional ArsR family regulator